MDNMKYLNHLSDRLEEMFDECADNNSRTDRVEYIKAATEIGELLFAIHKHSQYEDQE